MRRQKKLNLKTLITEKISVLMFFNKLTVSLRKQVV
jgi:hypothetical protein